MSPVQNISAPETELNSYIDGRSAMFGFSISGADIDSNGFDDIAIGSPNSEQVFVYKSYPIVAIEAELKIEPTIVKLPVNNSKITVGICAKISCRKTFSRSVCKLLIIKI